MKTIIFVVHAIFLVACVDAAQIQSNTSRQQGIQITGFVSDCSGGKEIRMPRIDIYAYRLGSVPPIEETLRKLKESAGASDAQADQRFFQQYDQLLDLVKRMPPEGHVRTDRTGNYRLVSLPGNTRYLILMIGYLEDEPAFYDYKETARLTQGALELNFPMGTSQACGVQK